MMCECDFYYNRLFAMCALCAELCVNGGKDCKKLCPCYHAIQEQAMNITYLRNENSLLEEHLQFFRTWFICACICAVLQVGVITFLYHNKGHELARGHGHQLVKALVCQFQKLRYSLWKTVKNFQQVKDNSGPGQFVAANKCNAMDGVCCDGVADNNIEDSRNEVCTRMLPQQ